MENFVSMGQVVEPVILVILEMCLECIHNKQIWVVFFNFDINKYLESFKEKAQAESFILKIKFFSAARIHILCYSRGKNGKYP